MTLLSGTKCGMLGRLKCHIYFESHCKNKSFRAFYWHIFTCIFVLSILKILVTWESKMASHLCLGHLSGVDP